jgi:hypothetical protein
MKSLVFTTLFIHLSILNFYGQIGIGTTKIEEGILLKIESKHSKSNKYGGILFPHVALTSLTNFAPVTGETNNAHGLIVYNTTTNPTNKLSKGLYFWRDNAWHKFGEPTKNYTATFSNQDNTTNLNRYKLSQRTEVYMDIFANTKFNNNQNLYVVVDEETLKIVEPGYYRVVLNLDLAAKGGGDNFGVEIIVNDQFDIITDNIYIQGKWNPTSREDWFPFGGSYVINVPINNPNSLLSVRTYEIDPSTDVTFRNPDSSTFTIQKIK